MARPLKTKAPLVRYFNFRLTMEEGKKWDAKVAASKLSRSEFLRRAVGENQTVIKQADPRISFQLSQLGNNINQIAHHLNSCKRAGTVSNHLYLSILEQLEIIATVAKNWKP